MSHLYRLRFAFALAVAWVTPYAHADDGADAASWDLAEFAKTISTPQQALGFVRDQVAFEPYRGVMKGAAGTFLTRGGNAWDRALLLAALLQQQGLEPEIVRAKDPAPKSTAWAARLRTQPLAVQRLLGSIQNFNTTKPADTDAQTAFRVKATELRQRIVTQFGTAELLLKSKLLIDAAEPDLPAPEDRIWVRAAINGETVSFDPDAPAGTSAGAAHDDDDNLEAFPLDNLPEDIFQMVRVRVVAEMLDHDGHLTTTELLQEQRRAVDLVDRNVRFAIVPKLDAKSEPQFFPSVFFGEDRVDGSAFSLQAEPNEANAQADNSSGGMMGGLGFGGASDDAKPTPKPAASKSTSALPRLGRLWVEFGTQGPGGSSDVARRVIIDRVEKTEGDRWHVVVSLEKDRSVRPLLWQMWDIYLDVGAPPIERINAAEKSALGSVDPLSDAARRGKKIDSGALPALGVAPSALHFALASEIGATQSTFGAIHRYRLRPRLIALRHGFTVADWTHPEAEPRFETGIDLLNAPFFFAGDHSREAALRSGILDTVLELPTDISPSTFNTLPLFDAAAAQKIDLLVLHPEDGAKLDALALPAAVKNALVSELAAQRTIVVPSQPVAFAGGHAIGWWSRDHVTGYTIGKMELGGAQGMTEYGITDERIESWTQTYVKFLGNVLDCYKKAFADALGSVEVDYKNLSVNVTINHGDDPMPSADQVISCLRDAACDALKDFVADELKDAAVFTEAANATEKVLQKLESKAQDYAKSQTDKGCHKLLGG